MEHAHVEHVFLLLSIYSSLFSALLFFIWCWVCWLFPPSHNTPFTSDSWKRWLACKQSVTVCESRFEKRDLGSVPAEERLRFLPYLPGRRRPCAAPGIVLRRLPSALARGMEKGSAHTSALGKVCSGLCLRRVDELGLVCNWSF